MFTRFIPALALSLITLSTAFAQIDFSQAINVNPVTQYAPESSLTININLTDSKTGNPVTDFHIAAGQIQSDGKPLWYSNLKQADISPSFNANCVTLHGSNKSAIYISAPGYLPLYSPTFPSHTSSYTWNVKLIPAPTLKGQILSIDHKPLKNTTFAVVFRNCSFALQNIDYPTNPSLDNPRYHDNTVPVVYYQTHEDGSFEIPNQTEDSGIVLSTPQGYIAITPDELKKEQTYNLKPWISSQGRVTYNSKSLPGQVFIATGYLATDELEPLGCSFSKIKYAVTSDQKGMFTFDKLPLNEYYVEHLTNENRLDLFENQTIKNYNLKPLSTTQLQPLRLNLSKTILVGVINTYNNTPLKSFENKGTILISENKALTKNARIHLDGTFTLLNIDPGKPTLKAYASKNAMTPQGIIDFTEYTFSKIIDIPTDNTPPWINLGNLTIQPANAAAPNESSDSINAPDFAAFDLRTGGPIFLEDFRGKYIVLDFSAAFKGLDYSQKIDILPAYNALKSRDDVVFISLLFSDTLGMNSPATIKSQIPWTVASLARQSEDTTASDYQASEFQNIFLISPQGKILSSDLFGSTLSENIQKLIPAK